MDGVVLMDGKKLPADFYREIGYVTQVTYVGKRKLLREILKYERKINKYFET